MSWPVFKHDPYQNMLKTSLLEQNCSVVIFMNAVVMKLKCMISKFCELWKRKKVVYIWNAVSNLDIYRKSAFHRNQYCGYALPKTEIKLWSLFSAQTLKVINFRYCLYQIENCILWPVMPCSVMEVYRRFPF
jgi:hypothetical protein